MNQNRNQVIHGKHNKPILVDVLYTETSQPKPVVVFCHGYKGFKDWGAWNLMAEGICKSRIYICEI